MIQSHIFLIGYMGAGKSTVGRSLAARLEASFLDIDEMIEKTSGMPITDIFSSKGEKEFRALESAALKKAVSDGPKIIAAGGGIVIDKENRRILGDNGIVVYLEADIDTLYRRSRGPDRPLRSDNIEEFAVRLANREAYYEEVADIVVDATMHKNEIVDMLAELFTEGD